METTTKEIPRMTQKLLYLPHGDLLFTFISGRSIIRWETLLWLLGTRGGGWHMHIIVHTVGGERGVVPVLGRAGVPPQRLVHLVQTLPVSHAGSGAHVFDQNRFSQSIPSDYLNAVIKWGK